MADSPEFIGTGWSFPPTFTQNGNDVLTVSGAEDIHQSLEILLSTRVGERVMLEDYGCQLSDYLFEEVSFSLLSNISSMLKDAISEYEPRIFLDNVDVIQSDAINGLLAIYISYTIRTTNSRYNMVYPFYINEANSPISSGNKESGNG